MLNLLKDKKVIFFDVGHTLDAPASGDDDSLPRKFRNWLAKS